MFVRCNDEKISLQSSEQAKNISIKFVSEKIRIRNAINEIVERKVSSLKIISILFKGALPVILFQSFIAKFDLDRSSETPSGFDLKCFFVVKFHSVIFSKKTGFFKVWASMTLIHRRVSN